MNLDLLKTLLQKEWVRYGLTLLAGITIGAVFYPTKHIEERVSSKYEKEISSLKETHSKEMQVSKNELDKAKAESSSYKRSAELKISKLSTQVKTLESKQKTAYYKLVKPDGTIEIKKFSESEVNESSTAVTQIQTEFKEKVEAIEKKWETIHEQRVATLAKEYSDKKQDYEKQIAELKKEKITDVNPKKFGLEGGMMNDKDYYVHATGDLWGPVFMGVHGEAGPNDQKLGLGLGIRF